MKTNSSSAHSICGPICSFILKFSYVYVCIRSPAFSMLQNNIAGKVRIYANSRTKDRA